MCIESTCCLFLTGLGEVADTLQVADDTGHVVNVLRVAMRTLLKVTLVNGATLITYRIRNIEGEIVAAFLRSYLQQVHVLLLRQVLVQVHVEGRAAGQVLNVWSAVQLELVDDGQRVVLYHVEVAVEAVVA